MTLNWHETSSLGVIKFFQKMEKTLPRCKDGSLDMRFKVNRGRAKYGNQAGPMVPKRANSGQESLLALGLVLLGLFWLV